jgi:hypothetical protein
MTMTNVDKFRLKTDLNSFSNHTQNWFAKRISMLQAILVAAVALFLILTVRLITAFWGRAEAPEIDLSEVEL